MITLVYDVILGLITLSFFDGDCTYIKRGEKPVYSTVIGCLRRRRVRYLEYWHPA